MADDTAELFIKVVAPDGTERTFRDVKKGFEDTEAGAEDAGEAVDDSAESLKRLVRLQMGEQLLRIANGFKALAGAAADAFSKLDANASATAKASKQADQWAKNLRLTANEIASLSRIFTMGDVGDELADVGDVIKEVGVKALEAKRGSEDYSLIFKALGVDIDQAMTNATDATFKTIDALSKMENETNALVIADELLSDQGVRLVSYLRGQGKTLTELQAETLKTIKVTDEQRESYARLEKANADLEVAEKRLSDTLTSATAPAIIAVKNAMADQLEKLLETNPEMATFLGLTKEVGKPALDAAGAIFEIGLAFRLMGGNLKTILPLLGKGAGFLGIILLAIPALGALGRGMDNFADRAENSASRATRAFGKYVESLLRWWRMFPWMRWIVGEGEAGSGGGPPLPTMGFDSNGNPVPRAGSALETGLRAGASASRSPSAKQPPWVIPEISSPTGGIGPASPASAKLEPAVKSQAERLQAKRASYQSQLRREEAMLALATINADAAAMAASAAKRDSIEAMLADVEKQMLTALKGVELTDFLTEQAETNLRKAQERQTEASKFRADGDLSIGAEAVRQAEASLAAARAAAISAADEAVGIAAASLDLATLTGSLDAQEAAVGKLAEAYDMMATAAARAGDQVGALQAMTEKAKLQAAGAGKLTIGQELLAGGGVSGIEAIIRKYGGSMADLSPAGGQMGAYNSPREIGQAAGAAAGPLLGAAVNEAMFATVERAAAAMRAGVQ